MPTVVAIVALIGSMIAVGTQGVSLWAAIKATAKTPMTISHHVRVAHHTDKCWKYCAKTYGLKFKDDWKETK
jgi:hypothetical protein